MDLRPQHTGPHKYEHYGLLDGVNLWVCDDCERVKLTATDHSLRPLNLLRLRDAIAQLALGFYLERDLIRMLAKVAKMDPRTVRTLLHWYLRNEMKNEKPLVELTEFYMIPNGRVWRINRPAPTFSTFTYLGEEENLGFLRIIDLAMDN